VARTGERPLLAVAAELGAPALAALDEGRLFVDGKRVLDPAVVVAAGATVEMHAAREQADAVVVLARHDGLIFAYKPPGIATEPDHAGIDASLVAQVATLLDVPRAELHALSRLDVGVSGVVTLASDALARTRALELRARGAWVRRYLAIAVRAPARREGTWDSDVRVPSARGSSSPVRSAETRFLTVASAGRVVVPGRRETLDVEPALLVLSPVTGRTHQLRIHASAAGAPLLGDPSHGGPTRVVLATGRVRSLERVALHCAWVKFALDERELRVDAPLAPDLEALWQDLGGSAADWQRALDVAL
jgi:23S rRNA-/tRNA-specific pseudouridylate synthase